MVINWSEFAQESLKKFIEITKIPNTEKYVHDLFDYIDLLIENNNLGKYQFKFNDYDVRQLIFRKHKILYYVKNDEIRILALIHSSQDHITILKQMLKYLF